MKAICSLCEKQFDLWEGDGDFEIICGECADALDDEDNSEDDE